MHFTGLITCKTPNSESFNQLFLWQTN